MGNLMMRVVMVTGIRKLAWLAVLMTSFLLAGCNANVGVGMSVGVPVGSHGYMSVGTGRWL
jgi:predicted small secreted protein